jgi:hypothetical protein
MQTPLIALAGWPVPYGPFGSTVRSLRMMLADGSIIECSRTKNSELFSFARGGYGLFALPVLRPLRRSDPMPDGVLHLLEGVPRSGAPVHARLELLGELFKFYRQLGETVRHEDAPLAVATQIMDFRTVIPLQPVSSDAHQSAGLWIFAGRRALPSE